MGNGSLKENAWQDVARQFSFMGRVTLVLASVGWLAWFLPFDDLVDRSGTPLGGDYVMLYVAGQTVAAGQAGQLYNDRHNQLRTSQLFPGMNPLESWPYRYPPTVAAAMVPLSQLPFAHSFIVFLSLQLLLLAVIVILLWRNLECLGGRSQWMWAIVGCPLVLETLVGGQSSLFALAIVIGFCSLWKRNDFAAGAVLALCLYKPNVLALFALACLVARPSLLRGFLLTVLVGVVIATWTSGLSGLIDYLKLGTQLASSQWSLETPYWKVHGLAQHFQALTPEHGKLLCSMSGLLIAAAITYYWRSSRLGDYAAFALLLCVNSLFNPYVPIYDLVLLIAALAFAAEAGYRGQLPALHPRIFHALAAVLFFGPHLSQALSIQLGWQAFPLVLLSVLLCELVQSYHYYSAAQWSESQTVVNRG